MEKEIFSFCSVNFEVITPEKLYQHSDSFMSDAKLSDVKVKLIKADTLPVFAGKLLGCEGEKKAYETEDGILRITTDICRSIPHIEMLYNPKDISKIKAYVREEDWEWATIEKYLWSGLCLNQLMLYFNTLFFHASYIDVNGEGILFTAPSQTGKSTQANLWCEHRNAKIINGDKAAVRLGSMATVNSIPFSGTSGICENKTLPLKAIVYLSQAPENRVERMGVKNAVEALCPNVFADKLVSGEWSKTLNLILDLVSSVPIYHLACTPDVRAVEILEKELYK